MLGSTVETYVEQLVDEIGRTIVFPAVDVAGPALWERTHTATILEAFTDAWVANASIAFEQLGLDEVAEIGREAGAQAAAAATWRRRVGYTLDTEAVTDLLGISRQALDSRKRTGKRPGPS